MSMTPSTAAGWMNKSKIRVIPDLIGNPGPEPRAPFYPPVDNLTDMIFIKT